jgi:hypothetical protein
MGTDHQHVGDHCPESVADEALVESQMLKAWSSVWDISPGLKAGIAPLPFRTM